MAVDVELCGVDHILSMAYCEAPKVIIMSLMKPSKVKRVVPLYAAVASSDEDMIYIVSPAKVRA